MEESYCAVHFIAPERKKNRRRRAEELIAGGQRNRRRRRISARLPCASKKRGDGSASARTCN